MADLSFKIDYVLLENGNCPFLKFLDTLNIEERADILSNIEELRFRLDNKLNISFKLSKSLKGGIFELRVKHLNKISRSLYFFQIGKKIVFTNGFIKKTEDTPKIEIEKALKYKNIYINMGK